MAELLHTPFTVLHIMACTFLILVILIQAAVAWLASLIRIVEQQWKSQTPEWYLYPICLTGWLVATVLLMWWVTRIQD